MRIDSLTGESISPRDATFDDSTSPAKSSSFQGTETSSVQDKEMAQTATEESFHEQRLPGIEKAIDRLYRLSLTIRHPPRSAQYNEAEQFRIRDDEENDMTDAFAGYARQIVGHYFPEAPVFLHTKLSDGLVVRRKRFLYRRNHQKNLSRVYPSKAAVRDDSINGESVQGTDVTLYASKPTDIHTKKNSWSRDSEPSHASATTLAKPLSPRDETIEGTLSYLPKGLLGAPIELPHPPKPAAGSKEFECPYCCIILPIKELKASHWRYVVMELIIIPPRTESSCHLRNERTLKCV